jgi:cytochrome c5
MPYLLFATSDMFCIVCHGNSKIEFSRLQSKVAWKKMTSDGGKKLYKIHKDNLDVQTYLKSDAYDEKKLFKYIEFFSESEKMYKAKQFAKQCFVCHKSKLHMSSFYTKEKWNNLRNSLDGLIQKHHYQRRILEDIKSPQFKNILPDFIKYISFSAPVHRKSIKKDIYIRPKEKVEISKIGKHEKLKKNKTSSLKIMEDINLTLPPKTHMRQIKRKYFYLSYDKVNLRKEEVNIILQKLYKKWKSIQKKRQKVRITLYRTDMHMYTSDFFFSLLTVGLVPVRYADTWVMKVELGGGVYYATSDVVTVHGLLADDTMEDNELLSEKVIPMLEYAFSQVNR